jgi:single-strand DNA-binding protein
MAIKGINKVILIGNLGNDPEIRYLPSGAAVANLSLATNEAWKDKTTGEQQDRTEWHRVVFFNRLGEICRDYLKKGAKIYVEGSLRTRKWTDKNGVERYTTEIIGAELQMLDSRGGAQDGAGYAPPMGESRAPASQQQAAPMPEMAHAGDDFEDDIPF